MSGKMIAKICLGLLAAAGTAAAGATNDVIVFEKWMPDESLQRWGDTVELWSVRSDGSDLRQLTHGSYDVGASWSPDRTRIAFARYGDLHVLRLEDMKLFLLPSDQKTIEPQWLDADTLLASSAVGPGGEFQLRWKMVKIDVETGSASVVDIGDLEGVFGAKLSPDRSRVAFTAHPGGEAKLFVAEFEDPAATARVIVDRQAYAMGWDPDGKRVVAVIHEPDGPACGMVTPEGGVEDLPVEATECNLAWSPSAEQVVYQKFGALWIMDADGRNRRPLVEPEDKGRIKGPEW